MDARISYLIEDGYIFNLLFGILMLLAIAALLKHKQKFADHNYEKDRERITGWIPPAPGAAWDIYDMHIAENYKKELNRRVQNGENVNDLW